MADDRSSQPPGSGASKVKLKRAGDYPAAEFHRMAVTGLSGSGKTVFGAKVDNGVTIVTEEISMRTIRDWNPEQMLIEAYDRDAVVDALAWAYKSKEAREYQTLVLDSANELGVWVRKWVFKHSKDRKKLEAQGKFDVLSLDDWNTYYNELDRVFRFVNKIPMHTIVLAQAFEEVDPVTRMTKLRPNFDGQKFPPRFPGYFTISGVIESTPNNEGGASQRQMIFDSAWGQHLVKAALGLNPIEPISDDPNVHDLDLWFDRMDKAAKIAGQVKTKTKKKTTKKAS